MMPSIERWRRYRRIVRELGGYSHRELSDLGIARADIPAIAWHAVRHDRRP